MTCNAILYLSYKIYIFFYEAAALALMECKRIPRSKAFPLIGKAWMCVPQTQIASWWYQCKGLMWAPSRISRDGQTVGFDRTISEDLWLTCRFAENVGISTCKTFYQNYLKLIFPKMSKEILHDRQYSLSHLHVFIILNAPVRRHMQCIC